MVALASTNCYNQEGHRHGTPAALSNQSDNGAIVMADEILAERFAKKYTVNPDNGCWEWNEGQAKHFFGYGVMRANGKNYLTHRLAYELRHGEIPAGMQVCHHCDNPRCCNPDHLFLGTGTDNQRDKKLKGRAARKLNPRDVLAIKAMHGRHRGAYGKNDFLARWFNVSESMILHIRKGKSWEWLS